MRGFVHMLRGRSKYIHTRGERIQKMRGVWFFVGARGVAKGMRGGKGLTPPFSKRRAALSSPRAHRRPARARQRPQAERRPPRRHAERQRLGAARRVRRRADAPRAGRRGRSRRGGGGGGAGGCCGGGGRGGAALGRAPAVVLVPARGTRNAGWEEARGGGVEEQSAPPSYRSLQFSTDAPLLHHTDAAPSWPLFSPSFPLPRRRWPGAHQLRFHEPSRRKPLAAPALAPPPAPAAPRAPPAPAAPVPPGSAAYA